MASQDKAALKALIDKREALELEMNVIISRLTGPNQPGLHGGLVDAEVHPARSLAAFASFASRE